MLWKSWFLLPGQRSAQRDQVFGRPPVLPLGLRTHEGNYLCIHFSHPIHKPSLGPSCAMLENGRSPAPEREWGGTYTSKKQGYSDSRSRVWREALAPRCIQENRAMRLFVLSVTHSLEVVRGPKRHEWGPGPASPAPHKPSRDFRPPRPAQKIGESEVLGSSFYSAYGMSMPLAQPSVWREGQLLRPATGMTLLERREKKGWSFWQASPAPEPWGNSRI